MFREARPYSEETFTYAQSEFDKLPDDLKEELRRQVIEKIFSAGMADPRLEATIFVRRDGTTGKQSLDPLYEKIVARLVRQREAQVKSI